MRKEAAVVGRVSISVYEEDEDEMIVRGGGGDVWIAGARRRRRRRGVRRVSMMDWSGEWTQWRDVDSESPTESDCGASNLWVEFCVWRQIWCGRVPERPAPVADTDLASQLCEG